MMMSQMMSQTRTTLAIAPPREARAAGRQFPITQQQQQLLSSRIIVKGSSIRDRGPGGARRVAQIGIPVLRIPRERG